MTLVYTSKGFLPLVDDTLNGARLRKMFGSRYNLHVAMAWAERENNLKLVQDEHKPKTRAQFEKEAIARDLEDPPLPNGGSRPPGRLVSALAVLGPQGWKRLGKKMGLSGRDSKRNRDRLEGQRNTVPGSADPNAQGYKGGRRRMRKLNTTAGDGLPGGRGRSMNGDLQRKSMHPDFDKLEFLAQYQLYKETRDKLVDEGYWDEQNRKELSEESFGFREQESVLNPPPTQEKDKEEASNLAAIAEEAGQKERMKSERRVVISSKPPLSTYIKDSEDADTGVGSQTDSRENTDPDMRQREVGDRSGSDAASSGQRDGTSTAGSRSSDAERGGSGAVAGGAKSDLMSRFYARLQELKENREEEEKGVNNGDPTTRNRDRMRIRTALRRLLASRLFPDKSQDVTRISSVAPGSRGNDNFDDGSSAIFSTGTMTPMTIGSRANTFSQQSPITRQGTRVVFVAETPNKRDNSDMTGSDEDKKVEETVSYYKRHPLAPIRSGGISRLYQPPRPPTRTRTSLSQSALQRDGLVKDKAFLQRMQGPTGIREDTRWSLPGERAPEILKKSTWRRERIPIAAWPHSTLSQQDEMEPPGKRSGSLRLPDLDDLNLRRLLEELYMDKKYMDKLIASKGANDNTEQEVCDQLEEIRQYLLGRALFWQERGPLPPRPPTTDLGMRLQRERSMQLSRNEGTLSRQRTNLSRRSFQHSSAVNTSSEEDSSGSEIRKNKDSQIKETDKEVEPSKENNESKDAEKPTSPKKNDVTSHESPPARQPSPAACSISAKDDYSPQMDEQPPPKPNETSPVGSQTSSVARQPSTTINQPPQVPHGMSTTSQHTSPGARQTPSLDHQQSSESHHPSRLGVQQSQEPYYTMQSLHTSKGDDQTTRKGSQDSALESTDSGLEMNVEEADRTAQSPPPHTQATDADMQTEQKTGEVGDIESIKDDEPNEQQHAA